ncbi:MAG: nitroreductase [Parvularculaceae bacterium]|nr:nitroreductase [Parvularculaceae bacterium]
MIEKISPPDFGATMAPAHPSDGARRLLGLRRSLSPDLMQEPGPDAATLDAILESAARVPDHRKMVPFRFLVIEGEGRARAGDILAARFAATNADAPADKIELERRRFLRAPAVVAVIARIDPAHKTPAWEQELTTGAVCLNMLLAASAYGFAGCWLTEWYSYDSGVAAGLALSESERLAGFIYIGSAREAPRERQRPVMAGIVRRF